MLDRTLCIQPAFYVGFVPDLVNFDSDITRSMFKDWPDFIAKDRQFYGARPS